jgi:hypothetical protein
MHVVEQHRPPDGLLTFRVLRDEAGDYELGFEGYDWHTHGDILASTSGLSASVAVRRFTDELIGRAIIAIARIGDDIRDVWVTEKPAADPYKAENEIIEFRYWDGRRAA